MNSARVIIIFFFVVLQFVGFSECSGESLPNRPRFACNREAIRSSIDDNVDLISPRFTTKLPQNEATFAELASSKTNLSLGKNFIKISPQPNKNYQQCVTPSGKNGHCKHVQHCMTSDIKSNFWKFFDYFCVIERSVMGVCCPDEITERNSLLVASLPASGSDHVDPWEVQDEEDDHGETSNDDPQDRGCGVATKQFPKIAGGRPADPGEYPWMAALITKNAATGAFCGGVLITDRHVLSAAHCSNRIKIQDLYVRLGEYSFDMANETRTRDFRVAEIRQHADFDTATYENDIAILKLLRPSLFNSYIWPICMPSIGGSYDGKRAVVIGWGTQFFGGPNSLTLMEVTVPIWRNDDCQEKYAHKIHETVLCAGASKVDACQGDSGGPLMMQLANNRWTVVGIVSWGVRCGEPDHPGIYTRVSKYIDWIIENATF